MTGKKREGEQGRNPVSGEHRRAGNYHNDYSPRYGEGYDIYRKAADHARQLKLLRNSRGIVKTIPIE